MVLNYFLLNLRPVGYKMNLIQQTNHRRIPTAADYAPLIHLGMESNVINRPEVSDDACGDGKV